MVLLIFAGLASHRNLNVNLFTSWAKFSGTGRPEALKISFDKLRVLIMLIFYTELTFFFTSC